LTEHVDNLENGVEVHITKKLKDALSKKKIKLEEFWKEEVKVKEISKDKIVFDTFAKGEEVCPFLIVYCAIEIHKWKKLIHPYKKLSVFYQLHLLLEELDKLAPKDKLAFKHMIKNILDEYMKP
jgi:hypothetical protein